MISLMDLESGGLLMLKTKNALQTLRPLQWVKNLLIFFPMLLAHHFSNSFLWLNATKAFVAFSFAASFVYILNDLLDLKEDRLHPTNKSRPLAAGLISTKEALFIGSGLFVVSLLLAASTNFNFLCLILVYVVMNFFYSLIFKKKAILDVIVLASFYTLRIFAGSIVTGVAISHWLLSFSIFIFLSLALVKRYFEILAFSDRNLQVSRGGYEPTDAILLSQIGIASGLIGVLVLVLYLHSSEVTERYAHSQTLWLLCPLFLYWLGYIWFKAHRRNFDYDPLLFALKDSTSYCVSLLTLFILAIAKFG
ncbi:MAG: UbiA family prenyltransferase [Pseudobdellovibrionaceae bacterium]